MMTNFVYNAMSAFVLLETKGVGGLYTIGWVRLGQVGTAAPFDARASLRKVFKQRGLPKRRRYINKKAKIDGMRIA
jgi:hypothetical protein